jgi:phage shock protein PspC (stress-responsive transcriptional regulator)
MSEHITHAPSVRRLERSRDGRILGGVAAGLGRYFDLNPAVFRLGFIVLTILGGAGVLVYIAAVLVMPEEGAERSIAEDVLAKRREHPLRLVALGLVAVAILSLLARADTWPSAGAAWFLIFVAGIILLWTGTRGRRRGLAITLLAILGVIAAATVAAVILAFSVFGVSLGDGVGNRSATPATLVKHYDLGIGKLRLDLTHVATPGTLHAHVAIGELDVVVPRDARVLVKAHVKAGSIDALGHHNDGAGTRLEAGSSGGIVIDANVGAGHIEVTRAS